MSDNPLEVKSRWPKLSKTLKGPRRPNACQGCSTCIDVRPIAELIRWVECDDNDRETRTVVVLCQKCSDERIEKHPRLYREMSQVEPFPGAMPICMHCTHRSGLECTSEEAAINGGPGLAYEPMPSRVHLCRVPRSKSGWVWMGKPIESCSGYKEIPF